jgi:hypothetical protein
MPTYDYESIGAAPANSSFSLQNQPFYGSPINSCALGNQLVKDPGASYFEIYAATNLALSIPYQSYDLQAYDTWGNDPTGSGKVAGAYFNIEYGRLWYGINTASVIGTINVNSSYYSAPPSGTGLNWTAVTSSGTGIQNINGTINVFVPQGSYFVLLLTGPGQPVPTNYSQTGLIGLTNLPSSDGFCFGAESRVLMANGEYRAIKDIQRGDVVMQDAETNSTAIVSRTYSDIIMSNLVHIPAGLLGNKEEIICTELHPIWFKNENGEDVRVWAKDVQGVAIKQGCAECFNLQFDEEGTFIVDGIKVDSLSPYHKYSPLPQEHFIDPSKYIAGRKVRDENDAFRNKPLLKIKTSRRRNIPAIDVVVA